MNFYLLQIEILPYLHLYALLGPYTHTQPKKPTLHVLHIEILHSLHSHALPGPLKKMPTKITGCMLSIMSNQVPKFQSENCMPDVYFYIHVTYIGGTSAT